MPKPPPLPTASVPVRWEYKITSVDSNFEAAAERTLNTHGDQGWELVLQIPLADSGHVRMVLKRRKRPA
jgi:hypothetical protein